MSLSGCLDSFQRPKGPFYGPIPLYGLRVRVVCRGSTESETSRQQQKSLEFKVDPNLHSPPVISFCGFGLYAAENLKILKSNSLRIPPDLWLARVYLKLILPSLGPTPFPCQEAKSSKLIPHPQTRALVLSM